MTELTPEEIEDIRADRRYRNEIRKRNLEAIREELSTPLVITKDQARANLGLSVVSITEALNEINKPPPWEHTDRGFIEVRNSDNLVSYLKGRNQIRQESPIFAETVDAHNQKIDLQLNTRPNPWEPGGAEGTNR